MLRTTTTQTVVFSDGYFNIFGFIPGRRQSLSNTNFRVAHVIQVFLGAMTL